MPETDYARTPLAESVHGAFAQVVVQTMLGPRVDLLRARARELPNEDQPMFWLVALTVAANTGDDSFDVRDVLAPAIALGLPDYQIEQARLFLLAPTECIRSLVRLDTRDAVARVAVPFFAASASSAPSGAQSEMARLQHWIMNWHLFG